MINPVKTDFNLAVGKKSENEQLKTGDTKSFVDMLKNNIENTNDALKNADAVTEDFALGKVEDVHQVTIATEKARVALNLTLAIQNKVMEAYKEVMRLQV